MKIGVFAREAVAALCLTLLLAGPGNAARTQLDLRPVERGSVKTLAGDGLSGYRDGPALKAQFMLPGALAYNRSGQLYIVDQAAQRIRMLWNGSVTTIAGSGNSVGLGQYVKGGYKNGPALQARFDGPSGIAVTSDGTIYVADEFNHCIRRIKDGIVTTFSGSPKLPGSADGSLATATFTFPRALAVDAKNNLYVADYGVGIRKIDPEGTVTTLKQENGGSKKFLGVTTWSSGSSLVVFAVDKAGRFYRFRPGRAAEHWGFAENGLSNSYGIVAVSKDEFLATDVRDNVIRSVRPPQLPFVSHPLTAVVAGTALKEGEAGGYRNGSIKRAQFYAPLGLAIQGHHLVIADAGNRRVRIMPLPDTRGPITLTSPELAPDPAHYRILYIGLSHAFYATGWSGSIPGRTESLLLANQARLGLTRQPRISVARVDGARLVGLDGFIRAVASDGEFNLVILSIVPEVLGANPPPVAHAMLRKLNAKLHRSGTKLFVFLMPDDFAMSPVDRVVTQDPLPNVFGSSHLSYERSTVEDLNAAGVPSYSALGDVLRYEQTARHMPLSIPEDDHPNAFGRNFIAQEIVKQLAVLRPWSSQQR